MQDRAETHFDRPFLTKNHLSIVVAAITLILIPPVSACAGNLHDAGQFSLGGSAGLSKPFAGKVGLGGIVGAHFRVGLGRSLSVGISPSYCAQSKGNYLFNCPLLLSACVNQSEVLPLTLSGGIGAALSDLPQWSNSNRALSGLLGMSALLVSRDSYQFDIELMFLKASTSTGNVTFAFLTAKMSWKL